MTRKLIVIGSVAAFLLIAVPAFAVGGFAVATATSDGSVPFLATAVCAESAMTVNAQSTDSSAASADVSTTRVFKGNADAPGATGTRVTCVAYNPWGGRIGGCEMALPGPKSVCVGFVDTPLSWTTLRLCAEVWAQYLDTSTAQSRPCP